MTRTMPFLIVICFMCTSWSKSRGYSQPWSPPLVKFVSNIIRKCPTTGNCSYAWLWKRPTAILETTGPGPQNPVMDYLIGPFLAFVFGSGFNQSVLSTKIWDPISPFQYQPPQVIMKIKKFMSAWLDLTYNY